MNIYIHILLMNNSRVHQEDKYMSISCLILVVIKEAIQTRRVGSISLSSSSPVQHPRVEKVGMRAPSQTIWLLESMKATHGSPSIDWSQKGRRRKKRSFPCENVFEVTTKGKAEASWDSRTAVSYTFIHFIWGFECAGEMITSSFFTFLVPLGSRAVTLW